MLNLNISLFLSLAVPLLLIPGPAVIFIATQSVSRGLLYGIASAGGIAVGGLIHVFAATIGLSAILAASATAFLVTKYLGAAYLIFLGVSRILRKHGPEETVDVDEVSLKRVFSQAVMVQILNPKIALFFLSFLPQFIDPRSPSITLQTLLLGTCFIALGLLTDSSYALLAAKLRRRFEFSSRGSITGNLLSGLTYIGLGLYTAVSGSKKTV